jgi:chemotaxis protein methyltransferase CheR
MIITEQDFQLFLFALKTSSKYDFSDYSEKSLKRRLLKVLTDNKLNITALLNKIKNDTVFVEKIVKEITVNTTELFRDPQVWHAIRYAVLPKLKNNSVINIWHAGCSTGQEVYSMMIILNELGMLDRAKIYASDINTDVMEQAQKGEYKYRFNIGYLDNFDKVIKENPYNYEEYFDVGYDKYFSIDKVSDTIKMHDFLREKPVYKKHDLVKEGNPMYVKFDIIFCRNVIIYFNYNLQSKVFDLFHRNLYDNSALILGMHETILGSYSVKFQKKGHIYYKN